MNLIKDAWITAIRANSGRCVIAPWQIAEQKDPVMELVAPRPDFQGAMYQFLIGLLQTGFAPKNPDEWFEYWDKPPLPETLQFQLDKYSCAFELNKADSPLFMQDFDDFDGEELPIEDLVGGAISDSTREKNQDLFLKRDHIHAVSPYWAALSLFNMQITGVMAWGKHRVGLRGNGPVTTLILPDQECSLWKKLWLNTLSMEDFVSVPGDRKKKELKDIFPWLAKTRTSPNKEITAPLDCNPLQHYWPLPRRIRLFIEPYTGTCDISGEKITAAVLRYKRVKDGVYYNNGWKHPLTPYCRKSMETFPYAVTGSKSSFDFKDWGALTLDGTIDGEDCHRAEVVKVYYDQLARDIECKTIIWCFGYDASNANVKCWYDNRLPLLNYDKKDHTRIKSWVGELVKISYEQVLVLKFALVRAWFNPRIDKNGNETWKHLINKKGDTSQAHLSTIKFVEQDYWRLAESKFYSVLHSLLERSNEDDRPLEIYKDWLMFNRSQVKNMFDNEAFAFLGDDKDIRRAVFASKWLDQELKPQRGFLAEMNQLIQTI
ncbi:MAG: type I-E CRISPR-associated protein Cse1/CasA [Trichlorobacter sp.]|nr:type I-E CRISPR-associated protein Cse1/CasA [Trichlorobacter sp.]